MERERVARLGRNEGDGVKEDGGMGEDEDFQSDYITLKMGLGIPEGPEAQKVSIDFAVHELLPPEAAESYTQHVAGNVNLDWYNKKHVPLRLHHLKSFLSDTRYSASDFKTPSWVALCDIDDKIPSHMNPTLVYTQMPNRSPREAPPVKRLEILDRRTCETYTDRVGRVFTLRWPPR
ncbi:hypothetical protein D9758_016857 [Tetrapyrgos nigripes]|uniref:Uncharacterized protein n=1 Tax=Tetrapyrgos nigripes TaxID=182062 RepID=A0A8H5FKH4_9AGAR|nr:hypothetical protein D9758_016857 [Tetrapyrgos nigripes]